MIKLLLTLFFIVVALGFYIYPWLIYFFNRIKYGKNFYLAFDQIVNDKKTELFRYVFLHHEAVDGFFTILIS